MAYIDETMAYLVAGRKLDARFGDGGFDEFSDALDELGAESEQQLVMVPAGAFANAADVSAADEVY